MPRLSTDDGPRRLRAVWLGPNGATLPFEWTYTQWAVVLTAATLVAALFGLLGWFVTADVVYAGAAAALWGAPAGAYLGVRVMRGVTFDEPLRYKLASRRAIHADHRRGRAARTAQDVCWLPPAIAEVEVDPGRWTREELR